MSPSDMPDRGSVTVPGFELDYRIEGTGPAALVIGSTVYYPRTFSAALRQHLRLIFMDHRGFGKASEPYTDDSFSMDALVDDIEALRQYLGLEQWIVIGHSGHGHMALAYAKKYPDRVSHVVIVAMSPDSSPASFAAADRYLEESVSPERQALLTASMSQLAADIERDPRRRFIHYSLRSGPRIWFDPTFDAGPLWEGVEVNPEMFDHVWGRLLPGIDITDGLDRLDKPVLVMLGRYDFWNPPHLWDAVRDQFADLRIRVFERSGHTPQFEQPDDFDRELLAWLAAKT